MMKVVADHVTAPMETVVQPRPICYLTPFEGWQQRNSTENLHGYAPRSDPEIKDRSEAKSGSPKKRTIEVSHLVSFADEDVGRFRARYLKAR